jgi:hypothetical protein
MQLTFDMYREVVVASSVAHCVRLHHFEGLGSAVAAVHQSHFL